MSTSTKFVPSFTAAADAAVQLVKREGGLWKNLAGFVATQVSAMQQAGGAHTGESLREVVATTLADNEKEYANLHKGVKLGSINAYRSAKSVALKAIECGVALTDAAGNVLGKTEVEQAIKEGKAEKTPIEKFRQSHTTLAAIADKLLTPMELLEAIKLLEETSEKMREFYAASTAE